MLLGDHAVVHDRQCLVTAVNQRLSVTVQFWDAPREVILNAQEVGLHDFRFSLSDVTELPKAARFVAQTVRNFYQQFDLGDGLQIETTSEFQATFGFGSSSAVTVATVKALAELYEISLSPEEIFHLAYKTVLDIQGVGSGFDLAAAIWGGTLLFSTGGQKIQPVKIQHLPLIVGYTGVKADTATLVKQVGQLLQAQPEVVNPIFDTMQVLVEAAETHLTTEDWSALGQAMNIHQGLLSALGVSSWELEQLIFAARQAGAWGAKLSGAGGGDCMIAIAPVEKQDAVTQAIQTAGGQVLEVALSAPGVQVERTTA